MKSLVLAAALTISASAFATNHGGTAPAANKPAAAAPAANTTTPAAEAHTMTASAAKNACLKEKPGMAGAELEACIKSKEKKTK
jgi:uncharacterized protein YdeI (BOF family)